MFRKQIFIINSLLIFFAFTAHAGNETDFYVSAKGNDRNPGTAGKPFATVNKAFDEVIKQRQKDKEVGIKVFFSEGVYYGIKELKLTEELSGTENNPVIFSGDGKVIFHGGIQLNGKHFRICTQKKILDRLPEESRGKVWVIDLKKEGITDYGVLKQHGFGTVPEPAPLELFINGEQQILARYPNSGMLKIGKIYDKGSVPRNGDYSNRGAEFGFEYDRINRWKSAKDIWLYGKFSYGYNDDNLQVKSIDWNKKTIKVVQPHLYGVYSSFYDEEGKPLEKPSPFRGYYAYNLLEEIDRPGEYFLDRETGKLYIYPATPLADAKIEVSLKEYPFFSLENASNIKIEGITFTCSRGLAVYLKNSHDITIGNCTFSNLGTVAVSMGKPYRNNVKTYNLDGSPSLNQADPGDFRNITIQNCLVFNTGTGGFCVDGGGRKNLISGNNLVYNCEFYGTDRINHTYSPAVSLSGVGNTVRNCYFHDLRHQAISFMGNNHIIEYCRFDHVCTDADDSGAVYTGRDPSSRGTEIRYNYFSNIEPENKESSMCGIYFDDGSGGMIIRNNFFYKVGNPGHFMSFGAIHLHGGHDNIVKDNIFMDCKVAVGHTAWTDQRWSDNLKSPLMQKRLRADVDILSDIYQKRYPELKNYFTQPGRRLNTVEDNLLIRTTIAVSGDYMLRHNIPLEETGSTPGSLDYAPVKEYLPDIQPFPFQKCGIINGEKSEEK